VAKLRSEDEQRKVINRVIADNLSRDDTAKVVKEKRKTTTRKAQPRSSTTKFRTKQKWVVVVTVPKKNVTEEEILTELEGLVEELRTKIQRRVTEAA
jgi:hypothetical protein